MTEPNKSTSQKKEEFISFLQKLADDKNGKKPDRAALARLRRGLGKNPSEATEVHPYIVPFTSSESDRLADDYYLVASLFALHQISWLDGDKSPLKNNLGASFAKLKDDSGSIEKRFVALLNCRKEDLPNHLRHIVSLLKSKDIAIDWLQLLRDLNNWDSDERFVQRYWAKAFWSSQSNQSNDSENQPENQLESNS
ncbi:MAG: type I-E CRISPR-associated protein Cse2/CasB [Acidobacteria bacterium]|nr:type I-E CRISPR-associated protein Cse2/CasB [Acidobacteriota bacterium]